MRPSSTAHRYAQAAFDVASQDGDVQSWLRDLRAVTEALKRPAVDGYFQDPSIAREVKLQMLPRIFPEAPPHVLNLLRILATKQRMHLVPTILAELEDLVRQSQGILEATVIVARPVDNAERQEIASRLSQATGKQVEVRTEVNPGIIGGIVVRVGDQMIDGSVAGRLERLRQQLVV